MRFQKLKPVLMAHVLLLLPADPDVQLSATLQHPVCLCATELTIVMIVD